MEIVERARMPKTNELYYICIKCRCRFIAAEAESEFIPGENVTEWGWACKCPKCGNICVGFDRAEFINIYGVNWK